MSWHLDFAERLFRLMAVFLSSSTLDVQTLVVVVVTDDSTETGYDGAGRTARTEWRKGGRGAGERDIFKRSATRQQANSAREELVSWMEEIG